MKRKFNKWKRLEFEKLMRLVEKHGEEWRLIAKIMKTKTSK